MQQMEAIGAQFAWRLLQRRGLRLEAAAHMYATAMEKTCQVSEARLSATGACVLAAEFFVKVKNLASLE